MIYSQVLMTEYIYGIQKMFSFSEFLVLVLDCVVLSGELLPAVMG